MMKDWECWNGGSRERLLTIVDRVVRAVLSQSVIGWMFGEREEASSSDKWEEYFTKGNSRMLGMSLVSFSNSKEVGVGGVKRRRGEEVRGNWIMEASSRSYEDCSCPIRGKWTSLEV